MKKHILFIFVLMSLVSFNAIAQDASQYRMRLAQIESDTYSKLEEMAVLEFKTSNRIDFGTNAIEWGEDKKVLDFDFRSEKDGYLKTTNVECQITLERYDEYFVSDAHRRLLSEWDHAYWRYSVKLSALCISAITGGRILLLEPEIKVNDKNEVVR